MAKSDKKSRSEKGKSSKKLTILITIASLVLIVLVQMTYVFIIIGMLPTIVAYFIDTTRSNSIFHTVFACNLSGLLPFIVKLVTEGNGASDIQMMITNLEVIFIIYLSAALGWILVYSMPHVARFMINSMHNSQAAHLHAIQKKLVQEWGSTITEKNPL